MVDLRELILEALREYKEFESISSLFRYLVTHYRDYSDEITYEKVLKEVKRLEKEGIVILIPEKRSYRVIFNEAKDILHKHFEEFRKQARGIANKAKKRAILKLLTLPIIIILSLLYNYMLGIGIIIGLALTILVLLWAGGDITTYNYYKQLSQMSDEELEQMITTISAMHTFSQIFEALR